MKSMQRKVFAAVVGAGLGLGLNAVAMADGKDTFEKVCKMCHATGVGGAPKFGNSTEWGPRIDKGVPTLEDHALHGFKGKGVMPPKGGRPSLSDDEVRAAVNYMVDAGKPK